MKTWLISDPHFSHYKIIHYSHRPFKDTEHMDNAIIEAYNRIVEPNDLVFWLGDMFFCNTQRMEYIASRLHKGRKILIRGNHDRGVSDSKFIRLGFKPYRMYMYAGILLTHEPISETNMDILQQYGVRRTFHGHTHEEDTGLDPTKWQCVSVEKIDYAPIEFMAACKRFQDGEAWDRWAEKKQMNNNSKGAY